MRATPLATAVSCLLAGQLLLGVAHVAMLPPWEGFDETAHYSYLQQLADRGELPRLGTARMSIGSTRIGRAALGSGLVRFDADVRMQSWPGRGRSSTGPRVRRGATPPDGA